MAVLLCREGEGKRQALSPEARSLPRVKVRNQPVNSAPHWRGSLRARTPTHVSYSHPEREEVWREAFERLISVLFMTIIARNRRPGACVC